MAFDLYNTCPEYRNATVKINSSVLHWLMYYLIDPHKNLKHSTYPMALAM